MKQLKPFTFWIVCGVIILTELGLLIFYQETDEKGRTPEAVKIQFDNVYQRLADLHKRAKSQDPRGEYDAENHESIKALTEQFLLTQAWINKLTPVVDIYKQQRDDIRKDLRDRSSGLHTPIFESDDPSAWYEAYTNKSKEILTALAAAHALAEETPSGTKDMDNDAKFRNQAGIFTEDGSGAHPSVEKHKVLAAELTIIAKIAEAIEQSKVKLDRNPVLEGHVPPPLAEFNAALVNWEWIPQPQAFGAAKVVTSDIKVDNVDFNITLQGPLAALIAAEGAIENIARPVTIVRGAKLGLKPAASIGERKGLPSEMMICTLNVRVLDFSIPPKVDAPPVVVPPAGPPHGPNVPTPPVRPAPTSGLPDPSVPLDEVPNK